MSGIYIHIPFCAGRCIYCGFYSTVVPNKRQSGRKEKTTTDSIIDRYTLALCKELEMRKNYIFCNPNIKDNKEKIQTIYLGGGTPSLLSQENLTEIFKRIDNTFAEYVDDYKSMEITLECNPDDVTDEFANHLKRFPINRISMGVQSFSEDRLRFLKRRHNAEDIKPAIERLRKCGINNISTDLMFGFPNQTLEEWREDIDKVIKLDVEHISAYSLMYESGTPLYRMWEQGKVKEINEELYRKMYEELINQLEKAGFEQYEISNFAKCVGGADISPYRSRHNSSYWHDTPYLGIGASAHSYNGTSRQWNVSNLLKYIEGIESNVLNYKGEVIDEGTHYNDLITTELRTVEGIDISHLKPKYRKYVLKVAQPLIRNQLLKLENNHLHLTREGIFVSDSVMSELIFV